MAQSQAVRGRVAGLESDPGSDTGRGAASNAGGNDHDAVAVFRTNARKTRYDVCVGERVGAHGCLRPAQILTSPMAQMFPVEVASAAGLQYLGSDPVEWTKSSRLSIYRTQSHRHME